MSGADDARKFARLADAKEDGPKLPRSGLELALQDRRPAGPDEISPEDFYAAYAARLQAESCDG